jgi:hypothetical protein
MPMLDDDFALAVNPSDAGNSLLYDYTVDSPSQNATFRTGRFQPIELFQDGTGACFVATLPADRPLVVHQMVEAKFSFASSPGATCYSGVFCRYQDVNNFVWVKLDHNTRKAALIERVAGVDTVLIDYSLVAGSTVIGASIRLEVIGKRARLWYEPHFRTVQDLPPDDAVYLTVLPDAANVGEWGVLFNNSSTTNLSCAHFYARNLPSVYAPPPSLYVEDASLKNPDFTPITATCVNVDIHTAYLQWQVMPLDPLDFAEAYEDTNPGTITTRVFFVRKGYRYQVRVRQISSIGGQGDWFTETVTATGSQNLPDAGEIPDDEFPVNVAPDYVLERKQIGRAKVAVSNSNRERLIGPDARPRSGWTLKFLNRQSTEVNQIRAFYQRMRGRQSPWKFTHPITGEFFAVRFDADEMTVTEIDPGPEDESPLFNIEVPIAEVKIGNPSVIDNIPEITLDASLQP